MMKCFRNFAFALALIPIFSLAIQGCDSPKRGEPRQACDNKMMFFQRLISYARLHPIDGSINLSSNADDQADISKPVANEYRRLMRLACVTGVEMSLESGFIDVSYD